MIEAEEYGITSKKRRRDALKSGNPIDQRIPGVTPGMGKALGVDEKWVHTIIKQVGNYGKNFDRNVGASSPAQDPARPERPGATAACSTRGR